MSLQNQFTMIFCLNQFLILQLMNSSTNLSQLIKHVQIILNTVIQTQMNQSIGFLVIIVSVMFLTQTSLAANFETAYFKALDQAFHSPGTQKVFIIKPKKCNPSCRKTIDSTQKIIRQMNLLRTVPFIVADAFSKNENLQIRLYDQNGKLSCSIISDRTLTIPESKIKALLNDKLFSTEPKAKTVTVQDFEVEQLQGSQQIINHYDTEIKRKRLENDEKYVTMNLKTQRKVKKTQLNTQQSENAKEPVQATLSKSQIRKMVSQQIQKSINKQELLQLVKKQVQSEGTITDQMRTMKTQFSNLKKQLVNKQIQFQNYVKEKRSLEKQPSEVTSSQNLKKATAVTDQIKKEQINNQTLFLKGALVIIAILACYIFVNGRKKHQNSQFRRVPNGQSFQSI